MEGATTDIRMVLKAPATEATTVEEEIMESQVRLCFQKETAALCNIPKLPELMDLGILTQVHQSVLQMFKHHSIPQVPLAGRLKYFLPAWKVLTQDRQMLSIVSGFEIPFTSEPVQIKEPVPIRLRLDQEKLIDVEVQEMLQKGAISKVLPVKGQYLSNVFLVPKKDGGFRPVINLKSLNQFIPYLHFKMESLHCLKDILLPGDYMCKVDLKDAYFSIPLAQNSSKYVRFSWKGSLYEFNCLCFGLGPAPRIFTKLLKVPISILRRLSIRVIIYLDDLLILGCSREEVKQSRHLGFVINQKNVFWSQVRR